MKYHENFWQTVHANVLHMQIYFKIKSLEILMILINFITNARVDLVHLKDHQKWKIEQLSIKGQHNLSFTIIKFYVMLLTFLVSLPTY